MIRKVILIEPTKPASSATSGARLSYQFPSRAVAYGLPWTGRSSLPASGHEPPFASVGYAVYWPCRGAVRSSVSSSVVQSLAMNAVL